jgi:ParB-like chromosome segregation protein Spo0J
MDRVQAMVEYVEEGNQLPPVIVVGEENLLGDGHHRLAAARRTGHMEIEAQRIPGGKPEAIVAAITHNDIATTQPLNRKQRNAGIKLLLQAGWTQRQIAEATGVSQSTLTNIGQTLALRGELPKKVGGSGSPKAVAVLPAGSPAHGLLDTTLLRIASVPVEQQVELAEAVAASGLAEPRVRDAIKLIKSEGLSPAEAVEAVAPRGPRTMPKQPIDVARLARQRIEHFVRDPMTIDGREMDFWQVLDVLASQPQRLTLQAGEISRLLADLAVKADHYATLMRSAQELEAVR